MPRPLSLSNFPPEFEAILRTASHLTAIQSGTFRIDCDTPAQAQSMRNKLYSYFRAVKEAPKGVSDLALAACDIQLTIHGADLVLSSKRDAVDAQLLRRALGTERNSTQYASPIVEVPIPSPIAKLAEIRARDTPK